MPELRAADQERVAHVVAGVAEVAVRDLGQRLVRELEHRQDVGEDLGRVELVGQAVPDRHAGELGELVDDLLAVAAVLDRVVDPAEHAGRVLHRLLVADLGPARAEVGHVRALVVRRDLERDARPGRGLLEDDRDVLAVQARLLVAAVLRPLQVAGQVEQEADLARREVQQRLEAAVPQVEAHDVSLRGGQRRRARRGHCGEINRSGMGDNTALPGAALTRGAIEPRTEARRHGANTRKRDRRYRCTCNDHPTEVP